MIERKTQSINKFISSTSSRQKTQHESHYGSDTRSQHTGLFHDFSVGDWVDDMLNGGKRKTRSDKGGTHNYPSSRKSSKQG